MAGSPGISVIQQYSSTITHDALTAGALHGELNSKEPKFTKQMLQKNTRDQLLKTLQDEDIDFEKLVVHMSKAFSLTWVKQIALGKLLYSRPF
jgi:hypothetical protein